MRSYMRDINLGRDPDDSIPAAVGMSGEEMYDMYRLLAIAKYDERYVIPTAHAEQAHALEELATECAGLRVRRRSAGPLRRGLGRSADAGRGRELPDARRTGRPPTPWTALPADNPMRGRVNLLNWDGRGMPEGMFPAPTAMTRTAGPTDELAAPPQGATRHRRAGAGRHLAGRLAAARLPRRAASSPGCRCCAGSSARCPRPSGCRSPRRWTHLEHGDLHRAAGRSTSTPST